MLAAQNAFSPSSNSEGKKLPHLPTLSRDVWVTCPAFPVVLVFLDRDATQAKNYVPCGYNLPRESAVQVELIVICDEVGR